jgi:dihydropteroate synthase
VEETVRNRMSERNTGRTAIWEAGRFTWNVSEKGLIMGILNVTPDSFSDGGRHDCLESALAHARRMIHEGADILDIGGESTRPGSSSVSIEEEISRTIPVIKRLRAETGVALSIDTSKPEVAAEALKAGVDIINDVTGFRCSRMRELCSGSACGLVAMHMQGKPDTMQACPQYNDVVEEVVAFFQVLADQLTSEGIESSRLVIDPGIGFGKSLDHNLSLLKNLRKLQRLDFPIMMGLSRKSLIADLLGIQAMDDREFPTVALTAYTRAGGALIHRVHAVRQNKEALRLIEAVN